MMASNKQLSAKVKLKPTNALTGIGAPKIAL